MHSRRRTKTCLAYWFTHFTTCLLKSTLDTLTVHSQMFLVWWFDRGGKNWTRFVSLQQAALDYQWVNHGTIVGTITTKGLIDLWDKYSRWKCVIIKSRRHGLEQSHFMPFPSFVKILVKIDSPTSKSDPTCGTNKKRKDVKTQHCESIQNKTTGATSAL